MGDKLLAEWFWTDRWMGSRGFTLPLHARGLYREMLTQAWRRGAQLPNDHAAIRRCCGVTYQEWRRAWPLVSTFWERNGDVLVNRTQREIYTQALSQQAASALRGRRGAEEMLKKRQLKLSSSSAHAQPELKPPSPSPSPKEQEHVPPALTGALPRDHLRHAVCGRVCLIETQYKQFVQRVGGAEATAPQRVREWARHVLQDWSGPRAEQPIQGDNFRWWEARWLEFAGLPTVLATRPRTRTEASCAHAPTCSTPAFHRRRLQIEDGVAAGELTQAEAESLLAKYQAMQGG